MDGFIFLNICVVYETARFQNMQKASDMDSVIHAKILMCSDVCCQKDFVLT